MNSIKLVDEITKVVKVGSKTLNQGTIADFLINRLDFLCADKNSCLIGIDTFIVAINGKRGDGKYSWLYADWSPNEVNNSNDMVTQITIAMGSYIENNGPSKVLIEKIGLATVPLSNPKIFDLTFKGAVLLNNVGDTLIKVGSLNEREFYSACISFQLDARLGTDFYYGKIN